LTEQVFARTLDGPMQRARELQSILFLANLGARDFTR
jgi:hypothetical protein